MILTIIIILLAFVGCSEKQDKKVVSSKTDTVKNELAPLDWTTDEVSELYITTEKTVYTTKDTIIKYNVINPTNTQKTFPMDYKYLHKLQDGEWQEVLFKDVDGKHAFKAIAAIVKPGDEILHKFDLEDRFNLPLEKGKYRIVIYSVGSEPIISNTFTIE